MSPVERMGEFEIVQTRAGHRAMLDHRSGEVMHPLVGPLVEAYRLYVDPARLEARLADDNKELFVLLDVGLGAGSNACAAFNMARRVGRKPLHVVSFDRTADALRLAVEGAEGKAFGLDDELADRARELLAFGYSEGAWGSWRMIEGDLPLTLRQYKEQGGAEQASAVFWDMFSVRRNAELWSVSTFSSLRALCRAGATFHTYSGATAARSGLLLAGFCVGMGKVLGEGKVATEASVGVEPLSDPLGTRFLDRLSRSSAAFPADAPDNAMELIANHPQFRSVIVDS